MVIQTNQLTLYKAKAAVCSKIKTKQINAVWPKRTAVEC
jgi:hypothetical protein